MKTDPESDTGDSTSVNISIMTITGSRTEETDTSGQLLVDRINSAGHQMLEKKIIPEDLYVIRAQISNWIADPGVDVVISTGGTGLTAHDVTPEAVRPLLDKEIQGFGELFRRISYENIATSMIQSRALGGIANGTLIFCLPGSNGACKDGWDGIIVHQLNQGNKPCNMIEIMSRLKERSW